MDRADVLLIGGGVASARCARTLRRNGFDGSILLLGAEEPLPYNRPPLSKELLRDDLPDELVLAEPESFYARRNVALRLGTNVEALDPDARTVTLEDGSRIEFGQCLLGTGAEPRALPVAGAEIALLLRTLTDARRLRAAALAAGGGAPVTVVGGGLIGVEVASALAALGLRPTIVEMTAHLWGGMLGAELATWGAARLAEAGVAVRHGTAVTRLDADSAWITDERLPHAFVVAGIGVRPRVELGQGAGLATDDGILTDPMQRTSHPAIWAAGDVARTGARRMEHWHAAREAGERAALSMLGLPVPPNRAAWTFTEVAGVTVDVFGDAVASDDERWIVESGAIARTRADRLMQLIVIGSAIPPEDARRLVEQRPRLADLRETLRPLRA